MAETPGQSPPVPPRLLFAAVCCLGISSIITQLVLMRELLCVLAGNEMILGIILGTWFGLMGLGALLGRWSGRLAGRIAELVLAHLLVAVLPVADVFVVRALRNVVFVRGVEVGVAQSILSCLVLLAPYCLIAGYVLTLACRLLAARRDAASIGKVYFLDVLGDIAGGLLFSFVLVYLLGHFGILYVPAAMNLIAAVAVAAAAKRKVLAASAGAVALCAAAGAVAVDLDGLSIAAEYSGRNVVYSGNSPYGRLVVTESNGQHDFIENGVPLFSTQEVERVEETVHYAMAQRPAARDVLLVSGGVSGTAREVLKYPVRRVDYVELDPLIIEVARRFVPAALTDERITVHGTDGRRFVRRTQRRYDVVIVDVPDPSTFQINRFYTAEFFGHVRRVLSKGGVMAVSLGGYANYLSSDLARLIGVTHRTLREAFANVLMLPGGRVFFLASDGGLTSDVAARIEQAGVETSWVRAEVLRGTITPDRLAELRRAVTDDVPVNRDFSPVLYYYQLLYWAGKYPARYGVLAAVAAAALAVYLLRLRAVTFAVFTTGFAASALVVVVLVGFQIVHGYV
ncbi:MAG: fused MFS/spermidine synthase, partial [Phycisphaerae bacterium]